MAEIKEAVLRNDETLNQFRVYIEEKLERMDDTGILSPGSRRREDRKTHVELEDDSSVS